MHTQAQTDAINLPMLLDGGDANYGIKCVYKEPSKAELDQGRTVASSLAVINWRSRLKFGGLITQDSYTSFYARARVVNCNIVSSLTHVAEGMASGDKEPRPGDGSVLTELLFSSYAIYAPFVAACITSSRQYYCAISSP
ncbi:hypothetical protein FGLOB1_12648 [Fusarium globosum]|uniref:Uncharacterized protein n=1 Tax=Fusarium globosum TaxID=78864 RepID=A0A8H6CZ33_9HYPO|nr:hypothetical protein FGLOB1_12648 [Fusarium globosum]